MLYLTFNGQYDLVASGPLRTPQGFRQNLNVQEKLHKSLARICGCQFGDKAVYFVGVDGLAERSEAA
jgi:hypothetical protein